jgi:hypothetical protein
MVHRSCLGAGLSTAWVVILPRACTIPQRLLVQQQQGGLQVAKLSIGCLECVACHFKCVCGSVVFLLAAHSPALVQECLVLEPGCLARETDAEGSDVATPCGADLDPPW